MPRLLALLLLLPACAPEEVPQLFTLTEGGSWEVELEESPLPTGAVAVPLALEEQDEPATYLDVRVFAWLPDSQDSANGGICIEAHAGSYRCPLLFGVDGLWTIEGTVSDGAHTEEFTLRVEVY